MHIAFECSGGFANIQLSYVADTDRLPPDVAGDLEREVAESRIWELEQPRAESDEGPPDTVSYHLTLREGQRQKTMAVTDTSAPPSIRPLLTKLRKLALTEREPG